MRRLLKGVVVDVRRAFSERADFIYYHAPLKGEFTSSVRLYARPLAEMVGPYRARNKIFVAIMSLLDWFGGIHPRRAAPLPDDRKLKVLVANWGHLGDLVTVLPLIDFLKRHPRVAEVGVVIGQWGLPVLALSNVATRVHVINHWALDRRPVSLIDKVFRYISQVSAISREIEAFRYDVSIDTFSTFPATHRITWRARIPFRIGFTSSGLGSYLTHPTHWTFDDDAFATGPSRTLLYYQLRLLDHLIGSNRPKSLRASYPGFTKIDLLPEKQPNNSRYIVLHLGPRDFRDWPIEKWEQLARILIDKGWHLVATGAAGHEAEMAHGFSLRTGVQNLAGILSWQEFVTVLADASAIISVDTIAGHLGGCFGVRTIILTAGRQRIDLWRPNDPNAFMIRHPVDCAPCNRSRGCTIMACVRKIEIEEILRLIPSRYDALVKAETNFISASIGESR